jgi:hypothetical protein
MRTIYSLAFAPALIGAFGSGSQLAEREAPIEASGVDCSVISSGKANTAVAGTRAAFPVQRIDGTQNIKALRNQFQKMNESAKIFFKTVTWISSNFQSGGVSTRLQSRYDGATMYESLKICYIRIDQLVQMNKSKSEDFEIYLTFLFIIGERLVILKEMDKHCYS